MRSKLGCGRCGCKGKTCEDGACERDRLEMGREKARWAWASVDARMCVDDVGRERMEMDGRKA